MKRYRSLCNSMSPCSRKKVYGGETQRQEGRHRLRGEAMDGKHLLAFITGVVFQMWNMSLAKSHKPLFSRQ